MDTKRTDYPAKKFGLVQNKWNDNFTNEIKIVIGDELSAGNIFIICIQDQFDK